MPPKAADVAAKERNEYIPSYISKKPFWFDESTGADYLDHQRLQKEDNSTSWYDRGKKLGPAATKFRKGACENCGAITHKTKDCLSRPRKLGARWTGKDIQADENIQNVQMGWDAKRDRWNGYDAREYKQVIDDYEELERLKKEKKKSETQTNGEDGEDGADEEAKYAEESDMGRKQATSTRNLRIREDTAKYLVNLDLDSAKYDPKTRSMVDMGAIQDQAASLVAEENFMKASGDAAEFEKAQHYAWETQERGDKNKIHLQANPTSGEFLRKKELQEAQAKREANRKALLEKYGGEQHLQAAPLKDAAVLENERYIEYDEKGGIKGAPKPEAKSKYKEDVFHNNHTSVWGSWWHDFKWGYQCCFSTTKNSYCLGEAGRKAFEDSQRMATGVMLEDAPREDREPLNGEAENEAVEDRRDISEPAEEKPKKKRTLQEMQSGVGEDEMEEYHRKKTVANDPMAKLLGKDELVH